MFELKYKGYTIYVDYLVKEDLFKVIIKETNTTLQSKDIDYLIKSFKQKIDGYLDK